MIIKKNSIDLKNMLWCSHDPRRMKHIFRDDYTNEKHSADFMLLHCSRFVRDYLSAAKQKLVPRSLLSNPSNKFIVSPATCFIGIKNLDAVDIVASSSTYVAVFRPLSSFISIVPFFRIFGSCFFPSYLDRTM